MIKLRNILFATALLFFVACDDNKEKDEGDIKDDDIIEEKHETDNTSTAPVENNADDPNSVTIEAGKDGAGIEVESNTGPDVNVDVDKEKGKVVIENEDTKTKIKVKDKDNDDNN